MALSIKKKELPGPPTKTLEEYLKSGKTKAEHASYMIGVNKVKNLKRTRP